MKYKVVPCKYFLNNEECNYGLFCHFIRGHIESNLRSNLNIKFHKYKKHQMEYNTGYIAEQLKKSNQGNDHLKDTIDYFEDKLNDYYDDKDKLRNNNQKLKGKN